MRPADELVCYGVMLLVAAVATITDLRRGVIPNRLVALGLVGAVALQVGLWAGASDLLGGGARDEAATARLATVGLNAAVGLVVGLALYLLGLWSAGDAKLAIALAAAQPAWVELRGPVPWAPVVVLVGNAVAVALLYLVGEVVWRGAPRLLAALRERGLSGLVGAAAGPVRQNARVLVAMAALAAALGPVRAAAVSSFGGRVAGGAFLTFLLLYALYRPLRTLALRRGGLLASLALLVGVLVYGLARSGVAGAEGVGRSLLVAGSVMLARGLLGASSRTFDRRRLPASELRPGMVLAPAFLDRLEADRRWKEAFAPIVGSLHGVRLDQNLVDNVLEWHAHNAPAELLAVRASLPFAPAMALSVVLTAAAGGLLVGR